jgi:hypothetical protein
MEGNPANVVTNILARRAKSKNLESDSIIYKVLCGSLGGGAYWSVILAVYAPLWSMQSLQICQNTGDLSLQLQRRKRAQ